MEALQIIRTGMAEQEIPLINNAARGRILVLLGTTKNRRIIGENTEAITHLHVTF